MYKILYRGRPIDIVMDLKFYRFIPRSKKFVCSDESSANCIQGTDRQIYSLQGSDFPEGYDYKKVRYAVIDEQEYLNLKNELKNQKTINTKALANVREAKVLMWDKECSKKIASGITIILSDNKSHTFELSVEDQLNLRRLEKQLIAGASTCIYHAKGEECKVFSAKDIKAIIDSADKFIAYETTYFNLLKHCIYNIDDISVINSIKYGDVLPDLDFQKLLDNMAR